LALGGLRIVAETVLIPRYRAGALNAAYPVILFNERQMTKVLGTEYASGRVGAEMIAERQHLPPSLWNDHLISFQELSADRKFPPTFNGRIVAVGHGDRPPGRIETGLEPYYDRPKGFVSLISKGKPWKEIERIDLCVCQAALKPGRNEASFAEGLKGLVPHIQGWASEKLVSPVGPLWELGTIREAGGSDVADLLYAIFPIGRPPGGAAMPPVPVGPAAGSWTRI
jgi:hypothetical protein